MERERSKERAKGGGGQGEGHREPWAGGPSTPGGEQGVHRVPTCGQATMTMCSDTPPAPCSTTTEPTATSTHVPPKGLGVPKHHSMLSQPRGRFWHPVTLPSKQPECQPIIPPGNVIPLSHLP